MSKKLSMSICYKDDKPFVGLFCINSEENKEGREKVLLFNTVGDDYRINDLDISDIYRLIKEYESLKWKLECDLCGHKFFLDDYMGNNFHVCNKK